MGEITAKTNLSRPAVSHRLRIMKDAGLIKVRKESTMNFYYFDPEMQSLARLAAALQRAVELTRALPEVCNHITAGDQRLIFKPQDEWFRINPVLPLLLQSGFTVYTDDINGCKRFS